MAAKEAEQSAINDENEELLEDQAPGDSASSMLIVSDSFENLLANNIEEDDPIALHKSQISDIVRHASQENDDGDDSSADIIEVNFKETNHAGDASTGEDSGEQSDVRLTIYHLFLFSCYSHQSISDYSWEVYIVHTGVFAG